MHFSYIQLSFFLLMLLGTHFFAKDVYVYDASHYEPFNVPSRAELLLVDNYVCQSGWIILLQPRSVITAYCHVPLIQAIDPTFSAHPQKKASDFILSEFIPQIDTPWMVIGDCSNTIYACRPPDGNSTWSKTCENAVIATYHLCNNAVLTGINSKMPDWITLNNLPTERASYQMLHTPACEKCICPTCTNSAPLIFHQSFISDHPYVVYASIILLMVVLAVVFALCAYGASYCILRKKQAKEASNTYPTHVELKALNKDSLRNNADAAAQSNNASDFNEVDEI